MVKIENIAIFGATGMTGLCVLKEALTLGFKNIKALLRDPTKLPSEYSGKVEVIKGDVTNMEDVNNTISNVEGVVVVLGTRNNLDPTTELSRGLDNIIKAMKNHNIKPISVCLSAFLFYEPEKVLPAFKHINDEHKRMLDILKSSDLNYIAVLPPHIADNPKSEYTVKHDASPGGRVVSKYELANFLVTSLLKEEHYGHVVGICSLSAIPRTITYKYKVKEPEKNSPEKELKALTGLDDVNYTDNVKIILKNPRLLISGLSHFMNEVKRFYNERSELVQNRLNTRVDPLHDRIDRLYVFEKAEDLKGYSVETDGSYSMGFSSASLKITQEGTALFSGFISEEVPKDGNVKKSGFATMFCPKKQMAFFHVSQQDWSVYNHLVFKIRGDGRNYLVQLHLPKSFQELKFRMLAQPLYTRGGPYWQIVKMPFSHFFTIVKGRVFPYGQDERAPFTNIIRMSITASGFEGPFKLEIDYVGLTFNEYHKDISPYEEYR